MSLAILPGSYDPMTLGHLELVKEAARRYDRVVVAVMVNPGKHARFDPQTRVEIARRTVAEIPGAEVLFDGGMLIDLYDRLGADAVVKGYRDAADLAYEQKMADWNRAHNPRFCTVLIPAAEAYRNISSTEVRRRLDAGESLSGFVHPAALGLVSGTEQGGVET